MVAAIAAANGATVATRNMTDFTDFGVPVIDPWGS
jgi:predicted nucleic acid-binding protein